MWTNFAKLTVRKAIQNASEEPLALLAEELRVLVLGVRTTCLQLFLRNREEALAVHVSEGHMDVSAQY